MKKNALFALTITTAALSMTACGEKAAEEPTTAFVLETTQAPTEAKETLELEATETAEAEDASKGPVQEKFRILTVDLGAQYEGEWDENGAIITASGQDVKVLDEGYDALKKSLDTYNQKSWQSVLDQYNDTKEFAKEEMSDSDIPMSISREIDVTRADSKVLSFVNCETSYTGGAHDNYYGNAVVFDTQTGKEVDLKDVVTDYDKLYEMVGTRLLEFYDEEMLFPEYKDWMHGMFYTNGAGEAELEWSLTMDGANFIFNPYAIAPWAVGTIEVKIPYEGNEDLFVQDYVPAPTEGTIQKVEDGEFLAIDGDRDGAMTFIHVEATPVNDENLSTFHIYEEQADGSEAQVFSKEFYGPCTGVYLVQDAEDYYYLYVEHLTENDFRILTVIDLNSNGGIWDPYQMIDSIPVSVYGHFVADAGQFALYGRTDALGTYTSYKTYHVGKDGVPVTKDEMFTLVTNHGDWNASLTSQRELTVQIIGKDGKLTEETLPKGTVYRPYQTDGETVMIFQLEDGRQCQVEIEKNRNDYQFYVNGISEYDCFGDLPYAG